MANLSIRNLPPELEKAIQREAKKRETTKTEVVLGTLMEAFNLKKSIKARREVRSFFGKMTKQEYMDLRRHISDFSAVDDEMWK
jgi:hypothetical protein